MSSCQDMGHQSKGNRDPFMVLAFHQGEIGEIGTLFISPTSPKGKHQNERAPISPILVVHVLTG